MKKEVLSTTTPQSSFINPQSSVQRTLFLVGPTASGKSSLAMQLALALGGEIVSADSQTIRRGLDVGTAKPSKKDMTEVRHHLIDIIEPYDKFNVAEFQKLAKRTIADIQKKGKLPIVVGGTGLYVDSLFFDYSLERQNADSGQELDKKSVSELQSIIEEHGYAMPKNRENPRHLIGTIKRKGKSSVDTWPISGALIYGIMLPDDILKERIKVRAEVMFKKGFLDEVKSIVSIYGKPADKIEAIGYPIGQRFFDGEISEEEAKELFSRAHWQYARRQKSWFKRNKYIKWFSDPSEAFKEIIEQLNNY